MRSGKILSAALLLCSATVLLVGCKKRHPGIFGDVIIDGRVTDAVSNTPIPFAVVELYTIYLVSNGLGGMQPTINQNNAPLVDTADAGGNYHFSFVGTGKYEYLASAVPGNDRYLRSQSYPFLGNVKTAGASVVDLACGRTAFAKVILTNIAPVDTVYFLSRFILSGCRVAS